MPDYSICYKQAWNAGADWPKMHWDVFLSAFNSSDRVRNAFEKAPASEKHWFISPEYGYTDDELPTNGRCFVERTGGEAEVVSAYFAGARIDFKTANFCIDITGFMRPHLLVILKYLSLQGVKKFDALYSEPLQYANKENTRFSDEAVLEVRQIAGFEGNHTPDTTNDILIVGAGYDHALIAQAAESKENARKIQLLGLPSLRADMYQENVLRAQRAAEQLGSAGTEGMDTFFAPANDPFETANSLAEIVEQESRTGAITNLYLCPVSTKVQTLGFGLYYLSECQGKATSMIFPFCKTYARETSKGLSRIWWYRVEFLNS